MFLSASMQEGFPLFNSSVSKAFTLIDFDAVIFDFDGVIADSEPLHVKTKTATLDAFGIPYTHDQIMSFQGSPESHFFDHFAALSQQDSQKLLHYKRDLFDQGIHQIQAIEGALSFIKNTALHKPCYLVTSSIRKQMSCFIERHALVNEFKDLICCDDVVQHKPHPEPYLTCMRRNELAAKRCLVIEDSPNGVISAKAAGCIVVGLVGEFTAQDLLKAGANQTVASYHALEDLITPQ